MMEIIVICATAFLASILTFFSGFGLGTLLLPVFSLFVPVELAVSMTALVHLTNNLFKLLIVGKSLNKKIALLFGLPAIFAAVGGAMLLNSIHRLEAVYSYRLGERLCEITPLGIMVGTLMIGFALIEYLPFTRKWSFDTGKVWIGGLISGFFGGLSGHQGALRSAFLIRFNLEKKQFVATGVVIACFIDIARLLVYGSSLQFEYAFQTNILIPASLAAIAGAYLGNKFLDKITMCFIQKLTAAFIILMGICVFSGII